LRIIFILIMPITSLFIDHIKRINFHLKLLVYSYLLKPASASNQRRHIEKNKLELSSSVINLYLNLKIIYWIKNAIFNCENLMYQFDTIQRWYMVLRFRKFVRIGELTCSRKKRIGQISQERIYWTKSRVNILQHSCSIFSF
jgi:hypothetical protein